ncbi:hypothetical protein C8R44DRAFT_947620 [Mycena epipterygia]|nr:hypothetical protein C8R44DRAFT_947620 [Mycena epipterygia]
MPTSDPILPPELEHFIFQIAALSDFNDGLDSAVDSPSFPIRLEPLLYRIVIFQNPLPGMRRFTSDDFHPHPRGKSPSFFSEHVRHLCIGPSEVSGLEIDAVLSSCSGVHNLFLIANKDDEFLNCNLLALLAPMPLRRLCIDLQLLFNSTVINFSHTTFTNITHLDVLDYSDSNDWTGIALLPCLTHLAFGDEDGGPTVFQRILTDCASLQVSVLLCTLSLAEFRVLDTDMRFVVLGPPLLSREGRQRGALGRGDYWATAEALIAKRRAGSVNPCAGSGCFNRLVEVLLAKVNCFEHLYFLREIREAMCIIPNTSAVEAQLPAAPASFYHCSVLSQVVTLKIIVIVMSSFCAG